MQTQPVSHSAEADRQGASGHEGTRACAKVMIDHWPPSFTARTFSCQRLLKRTSLPVIDQETHCQNVTLWQVFVEIDTYDIDDTASRDCIRALISRVSQAPHSE